MNHGGFHIGDGLIISHKIYEFRDSIPKGVHSLFSSKCYHKMLKDGLFATHIFSANNPDSPFRKMLDITIEGFNDWFIPNTNELRKMSSSFLPVEYHLNGQYWSSTASSYGYFMIYDSYTDVVTAKNTSHVRTFRPVRRI